MSKPSDPQALEDEGGHPGNQLRRETASARTAAGRLQGGGADVRDFASLPPCDPAGSQGWDPPAYPGHTHLEPIPPLQEHIYVGEMLQRVLIIQELRENQELSCTWGDDRPQGTLGAQAGLQSAEVDSAA